MRVIPTVAKLQQAYPQTHHVPLVVGHHRGVTALPDERLSCVNCVRAVQTLYEIIGATVYYIIAGVPTEATA
jgi:hypothetical protein